jgi:DNA-binding transcriptional MerR regulator
VRLAVTDRFTSREVIRCTGISPRQLQWWDEQGMVVPSKQGHRRLYSREDLAELAVICDLRRRGFSLQKVRKVLRFLQRELGKRLVETLSSSSEYHLLTDGRNIFLENSARQVVNVLKNARQPMLAVCLSDTVRRLQDQLRGRQTEGADAKTVHRPKKKVAIPKAAGRPHPSRSARRAVS